MMKTQIELELCPVCLDTIENINNATTNCGHQFHLTCLMRCFVTKNSCPICRRALDDEHQNMTDINVISDGDSDENSDDEQQYDDHYVYYEPDDQLIQQRLDELFDGNITTDSIYQEDENSDLSELNFRFPEIPEIHIINGERLFIKDGFLYSSIECNESERIASIRKNYTGIYEYEWFNNNYNLEEGEVIEHDAQMDEDELMLIENIIFTPIR